jgi:predicted amidohydrolase
MKALFFSLLAMSLAAATPPIEESEFVAGPDGKPAGWTTWSARGETAPRCFVDRLNYRGRPGALAVSGNSNVAEHGGWHRSVGGIEPGAWYRLSAWYRSEGVRHESRQILARLDWRDARDGRAGPPDYAYNARRDGAWTRVTLEAPAPEKASGVVLQFYLSDAPHGTVWWDDILLERIPSPPPRPVTIASINLRPQGTGSPEKSVDCFIETIRAQVTRKTDVILLPEGITVIGTGKSYVDVSEPIPGPTTARLGEVARRHRSYVVAGIFEREGHAVYNTAVLIDREGNVAGRYRKVYLPYVEVEQGLTPGNDYPVFRTDFGTVGMMICYDVFFADPARALTSRGAEIILMPIWGGDRTLAKARAIENKVFIASSGYDFPTQVTDPDGEILATAPKDGAAAIATVDLSRRYWHPRLGNMRGRRTKELRLDIVPPQPGFENR